MKTLLVHQKFARPYTRAMRHSPKPVGALMIMTLLLASSAGADVRLAGIFGDHMVLQQQARLPIWGTADPGEKVVVTLGDRTAGTVAATDRTWRVDFPPPADSGQPVTVIVVGKNTIRCQDVLIGDVWLASGQSNMAAELAYDHNGATAAATAKDPQLRLFLEAKRSALEPVGEIFSPGLWTEPKGSAGFETDQPGKWVVCDSFHASHFSAVAYYFGRELRTHLKRPVGLIAASWPGSPAEAWTSLSGLAKPPAFEHYLQRHQQLVADFPKQNSDYAPRLAHYESDFEKWIELRAGYAAQLKSWEAASAKARQTGGSVPPKPSAPAIPRPQKPALPDGGSQGPANLFNGMIAPIVPFAIKGVIWYQGENNTGDKALEYRALFSRLIQDWREKWAQGDFPFLYVQISHFLYLKDQSAPLVREAQLQCLDIPNTAMVVSADIPCDDAAHPRDKLDIGLRLALAARHVAYGENIPCSGPIYQSMTRSPDSIRITFTHTEGGLKIGQAPYQPAGVAPLPADKLVGFEIAGADQKFVAAQAKIQADAVIVSNPAVHDPVAVRYGWANKVICNLCNGVSLPASPFRTDDWPIKTVPLPQ